MINPGGIQALNPNAPRFRGVGDKVNVISTNARPFFNKLDADKPNAEVRLPKETKLILDIGTYFRSEMKDVLREYNYRPEDRWALDEQARGAKKTLLDWMVENVVGQRRLYVANVGGSLLLGTQHFNEYPADYLMRQIGLEYAPELMQHFRSIGWAGGFREIGTQVQNCLLDNYTAVLLGSTLRDSIITASIADGVDMEGACVMTALKSVPGQSSKRAVGQLIRQIKKETPYAPQYVNPVNEMGTNTELPGTHTELPISYTELPGTHTELPFSTQERVVEVDLARPSGVPVHVDWPIEYDREVLLLPQNAQSGSARNAAENIGENRPVMKQTVMASEAHIG